MIPHENLKQEQSCLPSGLFRTGRQSCLTLDSRFGGNDRCVFRGYRIFAYPRQKGFSLAEVLVSISIIAILASLVLGLGKRIKNQADEQLCRSELKIIDNALRQYFSECGGEFPFTTDPDRDDDGDFDQVDLELHLDDVYSSAGDINATDSDDFASSEALYFYLNRLPTSRRLIGTISSSLFESEGESVEIRIYDETTGGINLDILRFIDPWGNALRYTYVAGDVFPEVVSAGVDGKFDTADDLESQ